MKRNKIITTLLIAYMSLLFAFGLTACKKCEHTYDNACDTICNICSEERMITHTPNEDDGDCTTAITCSVCGTTTTPAKNSHMGGTATCTEKAVCTICSTAYGMIDENNHIDANTDHICDHECGKTDIGSHTDSNEDNDHVCDYGCKAILEDHKGGTATCVEGKYCEVCGIEYDATNPNNHASTEFTYTNNGDGTHNKLYACCDTVHTASEAHTFDFTTGKCGICDTVMSVITTTDGTNTYYAADAATLNQAVTAILEKDSRTFTVVLPSDAPAEMITAIRRAICDTDGVADGSINLTLKGVTSIPENNYDGIGFGIRDAQWDENDVEIVSHEEVTQLASVNLPDVTEIGVRAFSWCKNLVSVTAPKVQTIGEHAFGYTALTSVEFPKLTTIPTNMFSGTWTLSSAKFPKVTTIEECGLLIGAIFKPENNPTPFPLELTAEGDITFNGSYHFNITSQNYSGKVDLVLNIDKKDQVTFHDDGTATWQVRDDLSYTFKSITFACIDGTTNHSYAYTNNNDGTHDKVCSECGVTVGEPENHTIENHVCTACGAMEIVVSFDADDYEWKTGDELYFCRISRDNQWEEYCFTATVAEDGTVTWTPDKTLYWDGTGEHQLFVSYPCTVVGWDDFMIPTDQSDVDKLKEADCMNARWIGTPTTNVIEFELKHRMAKVTVNYTIASQFDLDAPVIAEIYSNAKYCKFSDADGLPIITSVGQYDAWITPYHNDNQFTVYVAPGEYNTDGMFKFYIGDAEVQIEIINPGAITLEEGGEYTFNVKVGQDVITIEEVSMVDIDSPFGDGWHNEIDLRAIGTQDIGKTAWEMGDQIIVTFTSSSFGTQFGTLTYEGNMWTTNVSFSYLEGETPIISAIYAPCYEIVDGVMQLKDGIQLGMMEYILAACSITDERLNISFEGVTRNYSRLRISVLPGQTLTVITTDFTPAGTTKVATEAYTLTADENGNIYLYGTFAEGATVSVKQGEVTLEEYTFTAEKHPDSSKPGINYALDARPIIDGTLGGETEATEEDINALMEQLKAYLDNGITTIIVTSEEPAVIEVSGIVMPAVSEAIYRLSGNGICSEDNQYNGKIDLILQDVTEIVDKEFYGAHALNSITLPKVTTVGDGAFVDCFYLREITFGSVVTSINQTNTVVFHRVAEKVDGGLCNLVLNCGQLQAEDIYKPNFENNVWFKPNWGGNVTWKSITLTHTGECDECK